MIDQIPSFFVSALLWHVTWGWMQLVLAITFYTLFLKLFARFSFVQACVFSLLTHAFTTLLFIGFIYFVFVTVLGYTFTNVDFYLVVYDHPTLIALLFAVCYGMVYMVSLVSVHPMYHFSYKHVLYAFIFAHMCAAWALPSFMRFV